VKNQFSKFAFKINLYRYTSGAGVEPQSVYAIGDIAAFPLSADGGKLVRMAGPSFYFFPTVYALSSVYKFDNPPPHACAATQVEITTTAVLS
jgi:hypothetical protein